MTTAYVGIGANLGDRQANMQKALVGISGFAFVEEISSLYETDAVPPDPSQPTFYNAACRIETGMKSRPLLCSLKSLEQEIGRPSNEPPNSPRVIDLDILLYADLVITEADLTLPHPRLDKRAFALTPLNEIATNRRHPVSGKSINELLTVVGQQGVNRIAGPGWATPQTG